jgi:predicted nuclease of restriction endonuclease-like (RecB) superfamily
METTPIKISGINDLVQAIEKANQYFLAQVQRQVNIALTLRNWVIGFYVFEYEQHGSDRAAYGQKLYKIIVQNLKDKGFISLGERNLYLCKDFYTMYPNILQSVTAKLYLSDFKPLRILQTVSAKLIASRFADYVELSAPDILLEKLSFSHFIELIRVETALQRSFYEHQTLKNNWSVRELRRAINSMLYERTGLIKDKQVSVAENPKASDLKPEDVFRDPYLLEFLGLEEKSSYTETDLEAAIITNLQAFLLEMGRGFCFEARQKRITFGNKHYRIDLVFFHRILKCHVLIDLKMDEFSHADVGQMNVYLNYYKEHEVQKDDNPPIGIILCAGKDDALVKYATMGLPQQVFVSKYLTNLPTETELQKIIRTQRDRMIG